MITCPKCKKKNVRKATRQEMVPIRKFLVDANHFAEDDTGMYVILCDKCGWFETLHDLGEGSAREYAKVLEILSSGLKYDGRYRTWLK